MRARRNGLQDRAQPQLVWDKPQTHDIPAKIPGLLFRQVNKSEMLLGRPPRLDGLHLFGKVRRGQDCLLEEKDRKRCSPTFVVA